MENLLSQLENTLQTTGTIHHAYFVLGDGDAPVSHIYRFLENTLNIKTTGNPDVWHGRFDVFSIDEARRVAVSQEAKDFSGNKKIFIIQTNSIGEQAQNSLLKVFEEPTVGTHFFILMPQDTLLPTLRSRMIVLDTRGERVSTKSILGMNFAERLALVKEITTGITDDEKTKQDAIELLNQIESELYDLGVEKSLLPLHICQMARISLYDNGAPVKMILENVMLSI
ncbi:MAG: hypothetical protein V4473_00040 [Patescibacteria group bacterium]